MLLLVTVGWAGLYEAPPEGVRAITVLICPADESCTREEAWLREQGFNDNVVRLDSVLALNVMQGGDAVSRAETFTAQLEAAKAAFAKEDWLATTASLDTAQRALAGWTGVPETQALFDLFFLRGAVKLAKTKAAEDVFRQAASVAWNRTVALPVQAEPYAQMYYNAQYRLLTGGLGTLSLAAVPGTRYFLDGVPLGEGPLTVTVFPGLHRLNAQGLNGESWRAGVRVQAFATTEVTAKLVMPDDISWLTSAMVQAVDERSLDTEVGTLLRDWCGYYGLYGVQLLVVEPGIVGLDATVEGSFVQRGVWYDPSARRFTDQYDP